jgi:hypothetical protein
MGQRDAFFPVICVQFPCYAEIVPCYFSQAVSSKTPMDAAFNDAVVVVSGLIF